MDNSNLSRDMQIVAEVIGREAATKLMVEIGGMYLYIPKPSRQDIIDLLEEEAYDAKRIAARLKISLSKVYKVIREVRDEKEWGRRQLNLFDE